jgi:hypothetical protein
MTNLTGVQTGNAWASDQYIGHKRIDVPIVATSGPGALPIAQVRLNCHRLIASVEKGGTVFVRSMSLHKKRVPWE